MSLSPLIEIAAENERIHALSSAVHERLGAAAGEALPIRSSVMLRPRLLPALLEDDRGLAGRPALIVRPDDRSARDLAADLRAYLGGGGGGRGVRFSPPRGTGYPPPLPPPQQLVGLGNPALDAPYPAADALVPPG